MEKAHRAIRNRLRRRASGSPKCFGLQGEPNVGKTEILQRFVDTFHCENTPGRPWTYTPKEGDDLPIVPVVWAVGNNRPKGQLEQLLRFYRTEPKGTATDIMAALQKKVLLHKTKIIVIDDVNNFKCKDAAIELKVMYENLKTVMFLFARTNDNCPAFDPKNGGKQNMERTKFQKIKEPSVTSEAWEDLLAAFEGAMPLINPSHGLLLDHSELIHERTLGKTGRLSDLVIELVLELAETNTNGEDAITEEMILAADLPDDD